MYSSEQEHKEGLLKTGMTIGLFNSLGFEFADRSTLTSKLRSLTPEGNTAMRDAIGLASKVMIDLGGVISQLGVNHNWRFVHVIVTNGDDNASKINLDDACALIYSTGNNSRVSNLKTHLIGIDLPYNSKAAREISALALSGGENAEYHTTNVKQLSELFDKIKASVGVVQRGHLKVSSGDAALVAWEQSVDSSRLVGQNKFVVLFTLDTSGSMSGDKWNTLCNCIANFVSSLGPEDLVGGILYNDTVKMVVNNTIPERSEVVNEINPPQYGGYYPGASRNYNPVNNYNQPLISGPYRPVNNNSRFRKIFGAFVMIIFTLILVWTLLVVIGVIRFF